MKKWIYTGLMALGLLGFTAGVWPQARTSFKIFDEGAYVSNIQSINCIGSDITCTENLSEHRVDLQIAIAGAAPSSAQFVTLALDGTLSAERVLTGTVNQIILVDGGANSTITLSTPQDIHTGASPTFANLNLDNRLNHSGDADTFIDFNTDEIEIEVGGTFFARLTEGATDVFTINPNSGDIDFIVETDATADAFTIDAGANTAAFNVLLTVNNISFNDAINQILFDADGTFTGQLTMATLTASQAWTLPDQTGTIALVSSVGGFAAEVIDKEATDFSTTLATEETVYSFTIPGGILGTESQIRVNVTGDMAGGTAAVTYRMKYGATTLITLVGTPGNDPSPVKIIMSLNADDATGLQQAHFLIFHDDTNSDSAVGTSAEDSTGDLLFELTVETTSAAQNYTMQHTVMELSQ